MKACWDEVSAVSVGGWYANRAFRHDRDPGFDPANDEVRDPFEFGAVQDLRLPEREHGRGEKASPRKKSGSGRTSTSRAGKRSKMGRRSKPEKPLTARQQNRWIAFSRAWYAKNPDGPAVACRDAAHAAGLSYVTKSMVAEQRRRIAQAKLRRRADRAGQPRRSAEAVVAEVVRRNPAAMLSAYQQALLDAGHQPHDRAAIEAIFRRLAVMQRRRAAKTPEPPATEPSSRYGRPTARPQAVAASVPRSAVVINEKDRCPSCEVVPDTVTGTCRCG